MFEMRINRRDLSSVVKTLEVGVPDFGLVVNAISIGQTDALHNHPTNPLRWAFIWMDPS
jgi:hypothetical protein